MDISDFEKSIAIKASWGDAFDEIRAEYAAMLKNPACKGGSTMVLSERKYITFGVEADNIKMRKAGIGRVWETDIINNFKVLGVRSYPLNGMERLELCIIALTAAEIN